METRKPTAKEPNALRQRLPRRATALAQGATLLVAAALLAAIHRSSAAWTAALWQQPSMAQRRKTAASCSNRGSPSI